MGRDGKTYDLGYKAYLAVDVDSDMPIAAVVASANENEKKRARAQEFVLLYHYRELRNT